MRTTITIPDAAVADLLRYAHTKKTTEAVNIAIEEWIRLKKISAIKKLRGTLDIDDNLQALRKKEIKKMGKWHDKDE
ncbi:MAG TPA: type II toxin-antitoxin system VapB family antitoxin [Gammaproteobacteria bacterium]|nr:type II toxin-antitoxin system VapB family antitoxin [Gammaproteobacteria bacterium]